MIEGTNEKKRLLQTGVFRNQNEVIVYMLARLIREKNAPTGAWVLKEDLEKLGYECGTATVGRYLKTLDSREYTIHCGNQGRILSEYGKTWLDRMDENIDRAQMRNRTSQAMRVDKYSDLVDLIQARKAIEIEGTRLAAIHATEEEMENLKKSVLIHYRYVAEKRDPIDAALDFHSVVADMSHNRFIKTMLDMLFFEEKRIEETMETLVTRERGSIYAVEHDDITAAIIQRNPDLAAELMGKHMEEILSAVQDQICQMAAEQQEE